MSPQQKPAPWWQTLVVSAANLGLGILTYHFFGPAAGAGAFTVGTAAAHVLPSPNDQK